LYEKDNFFVGTWHIWPGMAEFGIMGVLTELAHDTGISIPPPGI
jgi:predicted MFS family arabinose efflux permease